MLEKLQEYAANEDLPVNLMAPFDHGYIQNEPLGVVLIIGPWNYPYLLTIQPLIGAIAAGNAVVIKPSEFAPATAQFLYSKLPTYLDPECFQVVLGGPDETKDLLSYPFDHIFFTGSPAIGRLIYSAAAANLTPVTLELGGKCPCYIDSSADFQAAATRILWGKLVNLGQTCIAPDYILCAKNAEKEFIKTAKRVLVEWYGEKLQSHPDLFRIINDRHFQRLKKLIDSTKGRIVLGGKSDAKDLWIDPTIIVDVKGDDSVMQEEIFGPILPILTVNSVDEAIKFISARPKPLALYTFSMKEAENEKLLSHVSSGGACVNDCLWQNVWEGLPFGGVGESGIGRYHGKYSFETFSHKKAVLHQGFGLVSKLLDKLRYPPHTNTTLYISSLILSNFHRCNIPPALIINFIWGFCGALTLSLYFSIRSGNGIRFRNFIPPFYWVKKRTK